MKKWFIILACFGMGSVWAETPASLNEFSGTVVSIDPEEHILRMAMDGGYNVEFTFDGKTAVSEAGHPIAVSELSYGDKVTARYAGKDLLAKQIIRGDPNAVAAAPAQSASTQTVTAQATSVVSSASATTATPTP